MIKIVLIFSILFIFFLPAYLFIKAISKRAKKQKKSTWKGKLINKEYLEYEDDDSAYTKELYTLFFETIQKDKIKINVPKKVYEDFKIGDKAEKTKEKLYPEKNSNI